MKLSLKEKPNIQYSKFSDLKPGDIAEIMTEGPTKGTIVVRTWADSDNDNPVSTLCALNSSGGTWYRDPDFQYRILKEGETLIVEKSNGTE